MQPQHQQTTNNNNKTTKTTNHPTTREGKEVRVCVFVNERWRWFVEREEGTLSSLARQPGSKGKHTHTHTLTSRWHCWLCVKRNSVRTYRVTIFTTIGRCKKSKASIDYFVLEYRIKVEYLLGIDTGTFSGWWAIAVYSSNFFEPTRQDSIDHR